MKKLNLVLKMVISLMVLYGEMNLEKYTRHIQKNMILFKIISNNKKIQRNMSSKNSNKIQKIMSKFIKVLCFDIS